MKTTNPIYEDDFEDELSEQDDFDNYYETYYFDNLYLRKTESENE